MTSTQPIVPTRSAHWGWDDHRYFGHAVFAELTGRESLAGLTALSILGRRVPRELAQVLDDAAGALTLADPRIWPLKLTRLVASYGSALPAAAAGLLVQHEARIGPWAGAEAAQVLSELHEKIGDCDDEVLVTAVVRNYLAERQFVWGFGTPFRSYDERLVAFRACMQKRGRDKLPYWRTMEAVSRVVRSVRATEPNMGIAFAAALLDIGVTAQEIAVVASALMQHMFFAQAVQGTREQPRLLQELADCHVKYVGREARVSPRAAAATSG
jgi:hypothetical protein